MRFKDYFNLPQIIFAVVIIALMLFFAFNQSNNAVSVRMNEDHVLVTGTRFSMKIDYDLIDSAEIQPLPDKGEPVQDTRDDGIVLSGQWKNDTWGEYTICADADVKTCLVVHLKDGRTFVYSRKDDATTEELCKLLLERLPQN